MPVLYERNAREIIASHMRQIRYGLEDEGAGGEGGGISQNAMPVQNASAVLARFRECGWALSSRCGCSRRT